MSEEKNKPWRDEKGELVSFEDCKTAAHCAISVMEKEIKRSSVMQKSDQMYLFYERQIRIMRLLKEKFDLLAKHAKKVQRKTVKKRQKKIIH